MRHGRQGPTMSLFERNLTIQVYADRLKISRRHLAKMLDMARMHATRGRRSFRGRSFSGGEK